MTFNNIIKVVEKELKRITNISNNFCYQECDPEGPSQISKYYKEYKVLSDELEQLKLTQ